MRTGKVRVALTAAGVAAMLCLGAAGAEAIALAPGATVVPPIQVPDGVQEVAIVDSAVVAATWNGTYTTGVYRGDTSNPYCATCLSFLYQVAVTTGTSVARFTMINFQGFLTDVAQATGPFDVFDPGTEDAITADRDGTGIVVGFSFQPPDSEKVDAGETSYVAIVHTNATRYTTGLFSIIDGGALNVTAFAPAVPEPGTLGLLGLGLLGTGWTVRRRRKSVA